ncbi:quinolinate phosphoribosyltransferase [Geomicrobium sp. JCM 19037]|uniref:carboxylating nicotinate-nucleotide diphosphorylase n=1 Tax=Geomicrobium sp. JCM 19037 TaxID=1460634 RepID=UPI00045F21FB|nr:carboxylating nicotinate-nucleotide diphosphorylase [Geomicrobium sp. JCM 19037]GAK05561.1 quinolinate phosphoribosyltransferase [Geomicrobium sp. JCM 19037]
MNKLLLDEQLHRFLLEDIGTGDLTSESIFQDEKTEAYVVAKADGVVAGLAVFERIYQLLDPSVSMKTPLRDGDAVTEGDHVLSMRGPAASLLTGERVALNVLQRMSGIASMTHLAVDALGDRSIRVCDTRKTTPGLRMLEKAAVRAGGGFNHRYGLDDAVMLKENHIAACGSISLAVERTRAAMGHMVKVEVETTSGAEVEEAVRAGADVIMFDNATPAEIARYVPLVPKEILTEASGGISMETIATFRGSGVDYLSLGFLTHSVQALDFSMLVRKECSV